MKRIIFLLVSVILCVSLGIAAAAASTVPDKVGYIDNTNGNDNNDGLSDATPKFFQGQVGGIGLRNLMYGGGTIVVCGDMGINSNQAWDYGGPTVVTGCYGGKDYRDSEAHTGVFRLGKNATLTVKDSLTFDNILFDAEDPVCRIRVPRGASLTMTDTVTMLRSSLIVVVEKGGKANIQGGSYLLIEGDGEITVGEKVTKARPKVGYIDNTNGSDKNDGLSDASPKFYQGQVGGSGLRNLMYGGGTIVACGDFGVNTNQVWDYGGPTTVTGCYDGKNYKDYDLNTGIFHLGANSTLTVTNELTFDDILFFGGENSVVLVPDGATVRFTEKVDFQSNTLNIVVEKGGTAVLEGGTYASVTGEGTIRKSASVKVLGNTGVNVPTAAGIAYLSNTTGRNGNDGLSATTPKQYFGTVSGNGAHNLLAAGGTLVVSGDYIVKKDLDWKLGGAATVTAKANGTDHRAAANNCGVVKLWPKIELNVHSDLTLENMILVPSDSYNIIHVKAGVTLTIDETVDVLSSNISIDVEKGGKAVVKSGMYTAVYGEGDIIMSGTAGIAKRSGAIDPDAFAKGTPFGNVGYISNLRGNDANDGRSDVTPKRSQGQVGGVGIRNMMYNGGTIVVCGNMEVATNQIWGYTAEVTVTGSYGDKDYRDLDAQTGVFKVYSGVTVTAMNELFLDDILFVVGDGSRFHAKTGAVLAFGNGVSVIHENPDKAGVCILSLDAGAVAVIPEALRDCFTIEGKGKVVVY